jgi:hypothetical protein
MGSWRCMTEFNLYIVGYDLNRAAPFVGSVVCREERTLRVSRDYYGGRCGTQGRGVLLSQYSVWENGSQLFRLCVERRLTLAFGYQVGTRRVSRMDDTSLLVTAGDKGEKDLWVESSRVGMRHNRTNPS